MPTVKLKKYDSHYAGVRISTLPTISLNRGGKINLNPAALAKLGLKFGDKISLFKDENDPEQWYVGKDISDGFVTKENKGSAWFTSRSIACDLLDSLNIDHKGTVRFNLEESDLKHEKQALWSLFTRKPIYVRKGNNSD